jgi:hypothetical protein
MMATVEPIDQSLAKASTKPAKPPTIAVTHLMGLSSFEFLQEDFRSAHAKPPATPQIISKRKLFY